MNQNKEVLKGGDVMSTEFMVTGRNGSIINVNDVKITTHKKMEPKRQDVGKYNFTFKAGNQLILPQTRI